MSQVIKDIRFPLFEEYCKKMDIDGKKIDANISDIDLKLKVLSTPQSQAKGFMEEPEPAENCGLLFVYDKVEPLSFWMKNVKFPLDIIFFDDHMKYIHHCTMEPGHEVEDHRQPQYHSKKPARFAVELPAGWCEKNMKPDCKLSF